jgi:citrate lyase gamma subunit
MGVIAIGGGPFGGDSSVLRLLRAQLAPVHEDVFGLRRQRMLVDMSDKGELDAIDVAETVRRGMNIEIPGSPLVMIPFDIVGVGVDNVGFTDVVVPIDPQDDLQVDLSPEPDVEDDLAPAQMEFLVEVVGSHERAAEVSVHRHCILFCCIHWRTSCLFFSAFLRHDGDCASDSRPLRWARRSSDSQNGRTLVHSPVR